MKKNRFILITFLLITLAIIYSLFCPFIIVKPDEKIPFMNKELNVGDTISPLKNIKINSVYLVFSRNDIKELPIGISKNKVLMTNEKEILEELSKIFVFKYTGKDLATCESYICIYNSNELIFKSTLSIKDTLWGLQNRSYGWSEAIHNIRLIEILKKFKPCYYPILFL